MRNSTHVFGTFTTAATLCIESRQQYPLSHKTKKTQPFVCLKHDKSDDRTVYRKFKNNIQVDHRYIDNVVFHLWQDARKQRSKNDTR